MIARLTLSKDPKRALMYVEQAIEYGDYQAKSLQAQILDTGIVKSSKIITQKRLSIIVQAVSKLDPHILSDKLKDVKDTGFMKYIIGKNEICNVATIEFR